MRKVVCRHVERARRPRFVDRDIDGSQPGTIHAHMGDQTRACVCYRDVVRDTKFDGLALSSSDDPSCIGKIEGQLGLAHMRSAGDMARAMKSSSFERVHCTMVLLPI